MALIAAACGGSSTELQAGAGVTPDPGAGAGATERALAAVVEPANAMIDDLGDGWEQVDRWHTEGAMTHWGTGCSDFDRLGDIFNRGTPETVVWARGGDRLFQRTDDFGWDAAEFAEAVARVPSTCPAVEIGSVATVSVTAIDPARLGSVTGRHTEDDPTARLVAIALDAYPHPSPETRHRHPGVRARPGHVDGDRHPPQTSSRRSSTRRPTGSTTARPQVTPASVVAAQIDALLAAPIEATGPFFEAEPPPSVPPRPPPPTWSCSSTS